MRKVFIPPPLEGRRLVPFLTDGPEAGSRLFQDLPVGSYRDIFERVESLAEAELVVLPHEYAVLKKSPRYLEQEIARAQEAGKKVVVSAYQDDASMIPLPGTVILRSSAYRGTLLGNEIMMPAYVEDLGSAYGHAPIQKGERAAVGFMGKAGFATPADRIKYAVRNYLMRSGVRRDGVYFRRRALASLASDPRIELSATLRARFSGNSKSIELDPVDARNAYIHSIKDNLFTLSPRGDGNYSLRFYETLSLGRIPILIDTDMPLPLEDVVPYDDFIVRVPARDIDRAGGHVADFFSSHDEASLIRMQELARRMFERHLFMPSFLKEVFARI